MKVTVIRPSGGRITARLTEFWEYRQLLYFLTWRDIKVRYKQTAIGIAWAILQPLSLMLVFALFFGRLAKIPSEGLPYPLFAIAALLPWQLFSRSVSEAAVSLVTDQQVITRVYFPRLLVPTATSLAALLDVAMASVLLIGVMAYYGYAPGVEIVALPAFVLMMLVTALGVTYWLSALNVEYRDVKYTLPFLTQLWLFLTPVVYPSSLVPDRWQVVYGLNPMTGVIEGFRWSTLGAGDVGLMTLVSALVAIAIFVSGIVWFHWRERTFVDVLGSGGR
jgi:lipopolysaccharide transport system permease protein